MLTPACLIAEKTSLWTGHCGYCTETGLASTLQAKQPAIQLLGAVGRTAHPFCCNRHSACSTTTLCDIHAGCPTCAASFEAVLVHIHSLSWRALTLTTMPQISSPSVNCSPMHAIICNDKIGMTVSFDTIVDKKRRHKQVTRHTGPCKAYSNLQLLGSRWCIDVHHTMA